MSAIDLLTRARGLTREFPLPLFDPTYPVFAAIQLVFDKIDEIFDELFFEIMVGPEAYELMPDVGVVLNRLAVSCGCLLSRSI